MRYLAVAHFGRGRGDFVENGHPPHWRPAVEQAVGAEAEALRDIWKAAETPRNAGGDRAAAAADRRTGAADGAGGALLTPAMAEPTPLLLAVTAGIAFLGAFAQGVTGFGSALVAMPLLALVIGVRDAAALVALLSLAINVALLVPARRALPWRQVGPLLAGSAAGIPVGVLFLAGADPRLARALLGATLVAVSAALLIGRRPSAGPAGGSSGGPALAAGALAGLIGGAFNANGPVIALYAAGRGWGKCEAHAAMQLYFFASGLAIVALHGAGGITSRPVLLAALCCLPFVGAGSLAGWAVHRRVDEERYRLVLRLCLLAAGAALLAAAARG